jgi:hypothetical protein
MVQQQGQYQLLKDSHQPGYLEHPQWKVLEMCLVAPFQVLKVYLLVPETQMSMKFFIKLIISNSNKLH